MSISPRGMSVQEAYRLYREGFLLVNRRYQRKLVWTVEEKQRLIGSLLRGYPIPLILLAEKPEVHGPNKYEIIDGMQRLNSIFAFIENAFSFNDQYFAVREFARASQVAAAGLFTEAPEDQPRLPPATCAELLDYQLAVTIYPSRNESDITEVFGRINSGGKQLSDQEKRQAGVTGRFADLIRQLAAELRGDVSKEVLLLSDMPEISIETGGARQGYRVRADDTVWCKQGIITSAQLRDSDDEAMLADIAASVVLGKPVPASKEFFDLLYDQSKKESQEVEQALTAYGASRLQNEIKTTFSVLNETIIAFSSDRNALRKTVNPKSGNPIKTAFYAVFMAFFDLIVRQERSPDNPMEIMAALKGLRSKLKVSAHYATTEDRINNVGLTKGLIERHFVRKEPPVLRHGPGLVIDFENSLRRSKIETPRYEFKQGILRLSNDRKRDDEVLRRLPEMLCAIANLGPQSEGYLYFGIANNQKDASRIQSLDKINPIQVGDAFVVGIDREARNLGLSVEKYVEQIVSAIKNSNLSEPLKTQVLASVDTIDYRGLSVLRIQVPQQREVSFVGEEAFVRSNSSTELVAGPKLLAVSRLFKG
ncbi:DUF262 domain-containing protein [Archangium violaceum]|uniref:GmrSD restriction endonuclease domain-containing protein n=1 Tax=Archangium violaceum TaxID=83451 RepID=UPI002B2A2378|nr:DUF262 domain-containing protein [Archangium gephyra]